MTKVKLIGNLSHDGQTYKKGDIFEGDKALTDKLIALGAAADPKAVEESTGVSLADAEADAAKVKAKAEEEATKVVKAAQDEAAKVAEAAKAEADKIVADAKAKAEEVAKTAADAAKAQSK